MDQNNERDGMIRHHPSTFCALSRQRVTKPLILFEMLRWQPVQAGPGADVQHHAGTFGTRKYGRAVTSLFV
jgi:hypothetical protein